jgi:hypothetical protein
VSSDGVRFVAPDGAEYSVTDVAYGKPPATPGTWVGVPLGDARATGRVFAPVDRSRAVRSPSGIPLFRRFKLEAERATDAHTLVAQWELAGASWWDARPLAEIMASIDKGAAGWQEALGIR